MKVANLLAGRVTYNVAQLTGVILRAVFGVPDDFIDKVAEMKHEPKLIVDRFLRIFPKHSTISIAGAGRHHLTTNEREIHRPSIVVCGSGNRTTDPAAETIFIG